MEDRCIACGKCLRICPQNAKEVQSELPYVKKLLGDSNKVAVSLAPSFAAAFYKYSNKICGALKSMGFEYVEETVIGAEAVTRQYEKYAKESIGKAYITSCCPAVNELIQKYHPELITNLIPVVSPMVCHSRMMKEKYGKETKIVFMGPCLAKKLEAKEQNSIDAVLTFEELKRWFMEEDINFDEIEEIPFDVSALSFKMYPIVGGTMNTINLQSVQREIVHVDGAEECLGVLESIKQGRFKDTLIEMNLCRHGCINGPAMIESDLNVYERQQMIKQYALNCKKNNSVGDRNERKIEVDINNIFKSSFTALKQPSEDEIDQILMKTGKFSREDELNCGTCGYKTCRDKAAAVYNGMAELTMCLPYMRQKAENLSNIIFDVTPSIIAIMNKELEIVAFNPAAEKFFDVKKSLAVGLPISMLMEIDVFQELRECGHDILNRKTYIKYQDAAVFESVMWVENREAILLIMHDITEAEKQEEKMQKLKIHAIEMSQEVIDKQMRVAQEIASLLGETTAETKVSLTKLKHLVQGEEVDFK